MTLLRSGSYLQEPIERCFLQVAKPGLEDMALVALPGPHQTGRFDVTGKVNCHVGSIRHGHTLEQLSSSARTGLTIYGEVAWASLMIHELAHHYCPWRPGREECARSAQEPCMPVDATTAMGGSLSGIGSQAINVSFD